MTLLKMIEVLTVKDLAILTSLGVIGYNLYVLREAVKQTIHKHISEEDKEDGSSNSSVRAETEVSDSRESDDLLFGFQPETW